MASKSKKDIEQRKEIRENRTDAQNKTISDRIRKLMHEANISNKELAAACFRDAADVSRWLKEEPIYSIPVWELSLISDYLDEKTEQGCCIEYLIGQSEARHYEFDALVKSTGLSDAAVKKLIEFNDADKMESVNSLLSEADTFFYNYNLYFLMSKIIRLRKSIVKTKDIDKSMELGRIVYESTILMDDIDAEPALDVFKKQLREYFNDVDDTSANLMYGLAADSYKLEIQQQKSIKELMLFLESIK